MYKPSQLLLLDSSFYLMLYGVKREVKRENEVKIFQKMMIDKLQMRMGTADDLVEMICQLVLLNREPIANEKFSKAGADLKFKQAMCDTYKYALPDSDQSN